MLMRCVTTRRGYSEGGEAGTARARQAGPRRAFTLVELLLATVIGALVIAVAVGTLRSVARGREQAEYYSQMLAHGRYAINQIRNDLANFYRCLDARQMCLEGRSGGSGAMAADRLRAFVVSDRAVGERLREGDVYEVEYGLREEAGGEQRYLTRRVAPVSNTAVGNDRGLLSEVSRHVQVLQFDYFDGRTWRRTWGGRADYPSLVRVTVRLAGPDAEDRDITLSQEIALGPLPDVGLMLLEASGDSPAIGTGGEKGDE